MATPPKLTEVQREARLEKANAVRAERARMKSALKEGMLSLEDVLDDDSDAARNMQVRHLLLSLPGIGVAKAARIMEACSIKDGRRVRGLGSKQEAALIEAVKKLS